MNDNHYLFKCATFFILLVSSFWQNSKLVSVETWRETIETYTWLELWILFPPFFVRFRRSRSRNNSTIKQRLHLPKNRETTFETDEFIYIFCTDNIFFFRHHGYTANSYNNTNTLKVIQRNERLYWMIMLEFQHLNVIINDFGFTLFSNNC